MFDTVMTIVGNVLTAPEWRRTNGTRTVVTNFKVASTSRRFDKETGRWVDGPSLRVRVTCWRRLAENVAACVMTGDPVIVTGRMHTRDWVGEDGQHRVSYELEAFAVGHDLTRGQGTFVRQRPAVNTSAVADDEVDEPGTDEVDADPGRPGRGLESRGERPAVAGIADRSAGEGLVPAGDPDPTRLVDGDRDAAGTQAARRAEDATGVLTGETATGSDRSDVDDDPGGDDGDADDAPGHGEPGVAEGPDDRAGRGRRRGRLATAA